MLEKETPTLMENEALHNAFSEIKRADHLIFVSLKYTRTVDVIKNIIKRLIATYNYGFSAIIEEEYLQGRILKVPTLPRIVIDQVMELDLEPAPKDAKENDYDEDEPLVNVHAQLVEFIAFYKLLKKIDKAEFDAVREYRRHVTMTAHLRDEKHIEVSIDIISDYYERTKDFVYFVQKLLK